MGGMTPHELKQLFECDWNTCPLLWENAEAEEGYRLWRILSPRRLNWPAVVEELDPLRGVPPSAYEDHGEGRVTIRCDGEPVHGRKLDVVMDGYGDLVVPAVYYHRQQCLYAWCVDAGVWKRRPDRPVPGSRPCDQPESLPISESRRAEARAGAAYIGSLPRGALEELFSELFIYVAEGSDADDAEPLERLRTHIETAQAARSELQPLSAGGH
jgi:hypothetical protein